MTTYDIAIQTLIHVLSDGIQRSEVVVIILLITVIWKIAYDQRD